jgi:hypothetical protein
MKRIEKALVILAASCILVSLLTIGFLTYKTGVLEARVTWLEKSQEDVLNRIDMSSSELIDIIQNWKAVGRRQPIVIKFRNPITAPEGVSTSN